MIRRYLAIYKACLQTVLANITAYRADFLMRSLITLLSSSVLPLATLWLYQNGLHFPGWSMWEVLLIQSVYTLSDMAAASLFQGILWSTMDHIREGSFETILIKPVSPLFYLAAYNFDPDYVITMFGSMLMMGVALFHIGLPSAVQWLHFFALFLCAIAVLGGMSLMMGAISFKWVGNSRIPEIFESVKAFGRYPVSIFPKAVRGIMTMVIPVAMIGFFPASALIGRKNLYVSMAVLPCILFFLLGIWLYRKMIQLYEGVGG